MKILLIKSTSVQQGPTTAMQMQSALTLKLGSIVPAEMGSLEMDGIAQVHNNIIGDAVT